MVKTKMYAPAFAQPTALSTVRRCVGVRASRAGRPAQERLSRRPDLSETRASLCTSNGVLLERHIINHHHHVDAVWVRCG